MKKVFYMIGILILGMLLGFVGDQIFLNIQSSRWFVFEKVTSKSEDYGPLFKGRGVLFDDTIYLPEINNFNAKFKFIPSEDNSYKLLGYIVEIMIDNINKKDVPPKCPKEVKIEENITSPSCEVAGYVIKFDFIFKDKDDFEIYKITSDLYFIYFGELKKIQSIDKMHIPISIVQRVKKIQPQIIIYKCIYHINETSNENNGSSRGAIPSKSSNNFSLKRLRTYGINLKIFS